MLALELENLVKRYRAPDGSVTPVIDVPRLTLRAGEHCALAGESGMGKTTLLHLIAGILRADAGRILIAGDELTRLSEPQRDALRAKKIGYIFQTFNLLQGYSALENLLLAMMLGGAGRDRQRAARLLERVGLATRMHYRPRQLSVGQQQRVAVARALANAPALVLADEPTGNLDPRSAQAALTLIRETCRESGAALLLVSHDRAALQQFERVESLADINRIAANAAEAAQAGE